MLEVILMIIICLSAAAELLGKELGRPEAGRTRKRTALRSHRIFLSCQNAIQLLHTGKCLSSDRDRPHCDDLAAFHNDAGKVGKQGIRNIVTWLQSNTSIMLHSSAGWV